MIANDPDVDLHLKQFIIICSRPIENIILFRQIFRQFLIGKKLPKNQKSILKVF